MGLLQGSPAHCGRRGGPAAQRKQMLARQEIGVFVGLRLLSLGDGALVLPPRGEA
jgi:hypothetical protein